MVSIVELEEGYRMMANIIGCQPDQIRIGLPVYVEFHPLSGDYLLPYFAPKPSLLGWGIPLESTH